MISELVPPKIITQLSELIKDKTVENYYLSSEVREHLVYTSGYDSRNDRRVFIDGFLFEFLRLDISNGITKLTRRMELSDLFKTELDNRQLSFKNIYEQGKELKELRDLKSNLDKIKSYIKE